MALNTVDIELYETHPNADVWNVTLVMEILPSLCDYDIPLMAFLGGNSIQMYELNFVIRTLLLLLIASYHKCVSGAEIFAPHTDGSS